MSYSKSIALVLFCNFILACKGNQHQNENSEQPKIIEFLINDINDKNTRSTIAETFTLNKDKFLTLKFNLNRPLAQSLKELAPELSIDQLLEKGNFQFSIVVDNKTIYVENLNKGAGLKEGKTKSLTHTVPLIYPERLDFWGWYMWLKFMKMAGGRDVLDTGQHKLTIEVRPYLNDGKLKVGDLLAKGSIGVNVVELPYDKSLVPIQGIAPTSDWEVSAATFNRETIMALNKKIAQGRFENINGIVVIKKGKLLLEEYFNGGTRDSLHNPRSVGKTIASTIMGIAIDEKHIASENMQLKDFYDLKSFKNYSQKKDEVTLKSLLTMSSGFVGNDNDYNSIGNEELMYPTDNWVKFTLDLPMDEEKSIGKSYSYFTAGVVVLGDILHKSVPGGLVDFADKKLFRPLKITDYKWQYTPQNVGNTAGGIQLRALDFAKYGQLYKNKGNWYGKQLIPEEWVNKSLSPHVKQPNQGNYGYLFWNSAYTVDGKQYEVSYCSGNGGNKIFVFNDIPFVVVITASAYGMPFAHSNVDKMMEAYILPAILSDNN